MKPKDLLESLEKVDRTEEHLFPKKKKAKTSDNEWMNDMFRSVYTEPMRSFGQMIGRNHQIDESFVRHVQEMRRQMDIERRRNEEMMMANQYSLGSTPEQAANLIVQRRVNAARSEGIDNETKRLAGEPGTNRPDTRAPF